LVFFFFVFKRCVLGCCLSSARPAAVDRIIAVRHVKALSSPCFFCPLQAYQSAHPTVLEPVMKVEVTVPVEFQVRRRSEGAVLSVGAGTVLQEAAFLRLWSRHWLAKPSSSVRVLSCVMC
jgi:hypothetical protein